jgi:hypothetical protein
MKDMTRATTEPQDRAGSADPGSLGPESPSGDAYEPRGRAPDDGMGPDRERQRRDELADRSITGGPSPAGRDRPDLIPDVEPPDLPM